MPTLHVLLVFVGDGGGGGNPLGVFLDGDLVPEEHRQAVATRLGYSETVFVDDAERGEVRIFTPGTELPFAGHPLVGTAWLLAREGTPVDVLRPPAGEVPVRDEGGITWIAGRDGWSPPFIHVHHRSVTEIDALQPGGEEMDYHYHWAWEDEAAGAVRARAYFHEAGIDEDEATGSAAIALCVALGRQISIRQGVGSRLLVRPLEGDWAEVGGRTELVEVREDPGR